MDILCFFSRLSKHLPYRCRLVLYFLLLYFYPIRGHRQKDPRSFLLRYRQNVGSSCKKNNNVLCNLECDLLIIVPVYNVEKYLEECLDSIINQQTKYKFKIIAVNDGSKDNSYNLLKKYKSYDNVKIISQDNKGLSGARNVALETIDANYVMFVDSDDMLAQGAIDRLLSIAYSVNVDIVQGGYATFGLNVNSRRYTQRDGICKPQKLYGFAWGKIYKKELWENIQFPEKYLFEDTLNRLITFNLAKSAYVCDDIVYHYRINGRGITKSTVGGYELLDTVWISLQLYNDAKLMKLMSSVFCEAFINQLMFNYVRTVSIKDRNIDMAIFDLYQRTIDFGQLKEPISKFTSRVMEYLKNNEFKKFYLSSLILK